MAPQYDRFMAAVEPAFAKLTGALLDAVGARPGTRLLDLACGPGHLTAAALDRGASAKGIDLSTAMVRAARRRFPTASFDVGDMLAPPPGPWDAVACRFGIHHVDPAWAPAAWTVLRPGGRLAVAELGAMDAEARANGMHGPDHWVRLLEATGFSDVKVEEHSIDVAGIAAKDPDLAALLAEGHGRQFRGPAYVISGRKLVS